MSSRLIFEVRQREDAGSVEVAFFTDYAMALQMVDVLYRRLWGIVNKVPLPIGIVGEELAAIIKRDGIDMFMTDDKNSVAPIFHIVEHNIYNSIPYVGENLEITTVDTPFTLFDKSPQT